MVVGASRWYVWAYSLHICKKDLPLSLRSSLSIYLSPLDHRTKWPGNSSYNLTSYDTQVLYIRANDAKVNMNVNVNAVLHMARPNVLASRQTRSLQATAEQQGC